VCGKHTRTAESLGTLREYGADERLYRQDEPAAYWIFCSRILCSDSTQRPMVDNTAILVFHASQWNFS
jgi:hypothetical protein